MRSPRVLDATRMGAQLKTELPGRARPLPDDGGEHVTSLGAVMLEPMLGFYNVTKAAVIQLTRQLAYEMAPGVRVNAIAPGLVKTDMARGLWEGREAEQARRIPLRRLGETADIASAALFLASDAASWITGHTLVVDGGAMVAPSVPGEDQSGEL